MNFSDTPSVPIPREFLAVILAGFGNELAPLSSDNGDQPCPKALLPIANNPMISYPLRWLEDSGVQEVLLICPSSHRPAISHYIDSDPSLGSQTSLKIEIQTHDQSHDFDAIGGGTCNVLRHFAQRITGDFIILPCDFIPPPSLKLSTVLNKFRVDSATDGALMTSLWYEIFCPEEKSASEDVWSSVYPKIPIVYDEDSGTLLHVDTPDDQDENSEELELRMAMLWKYPRTKSTTRLADSHVYVCRHAVLDALARKPHFDSFREEFVPWLCKVHTQRTKREKYTIVLNPITNTPLNQQSLALEHSTTFVSSSVLKPSSASRRSIRADSSRSFHATTSAASIATSTVSAAQASNSSHAHTQSSPHIAHRTASTTDMSSTAPPSPTLSSVRDAASEEASLRCGIIVHRLGYGFVARANTLWALYELNRHALLMNTPTSRESVATPGLIDPKSSISLDSIVGESTRLGERSSVKKSVIGRHCVIGKNVKIAGCVIMEHCVIEDGAKLEGSLLGKNTRVGIKAELVRSVTQSGFEVEAGGVYKNEKLEVSDWTTAPADEDEDEDDDDDDEDDDDDDDDEDDDDDDDDDDETSEEE